MHSGEMFCEEQKANLSLTAEKYQGGKNQNTTTPQEPRGIVWFLFNPEKSLKAASKQAERNNLQYMDTKDRLDFRILILTCLDTSTETSQFPELT